MVPTSLGLRPFDPAAFAAERSPSAGITQEERTRAVARLVAEAASSIGGKTITHTLESSHSPFLSQPAALSRILIDIGFAT